jgi:RNA polymerase sigma-70 factor (ECF subfamily)
MTESSNTLSHDQAWVGSEETRIIHAARQDPKAFGDLYTLYIKRVFGYLFSRIGNVLDAEDITAQTFLAAFESFDRFRQDEHFASWLFTIARNKTMDHFRKRKNIFPIDEDHDIPVELDPLVGIIQSEQTAGLVKLIQELPEDERELLRLRFLAEMSYPEIAILLHQKEDAVKKTTYRLLARLHSQVEVSHE